MEKSETLETENNNLKEAKKALKKALKAEEQADEYLKGKDDEMEKGFAVHSKSKKDFVLGGYCDHSINESVNPGDDLSILLQINSSLKIHPKNQTKQKVTEPKESNII